MTALEGRRAIIAGAGRGIGRAIALAFADQGARLALAARTHSEVADVAERCSALGAAATAITADVSRWPDVERLVLESQAQLGGVDVLVNTAGVYGPIGPTAEVDTESWTHAIEVNLLGAFHLCRAVVPHMLEQRSGKVMLLAGGGATAPLPRLSAYAASKAAVVRFADTLAEELREYGIQVNAIAPGLVDTSLQDDVLSAGDRAGDLFAKVKAARETGEGTVGPELAAELAVFLASEASGSLTGKLISAPHDPWRDWNGRVQELNGSAMYTIRRLDAFTVRPLIEELA
jgi:3-oxoacyl-[acyl-carrier protein] reductase